MPTLSCSYPKYVKLPECANNYFYEKGWSTKNGLHLFNVFIQNIAVLFAFLILIIILS